MMHLMKLSCRKLYECDFFLFCKYIGYFLQEEVWIFIWSDVEHVIVIKVKLCLYILYLSNCVRKSYLDLFKIMCFINPFQPVWWNQQHLSEWKRYSTKKEKRTQNVLSNWMVVKEFLCFYIDVACFVRCLLIYFASGFS